MAFDQRSPGTCLLNIALPGAGLTLRLKCPFPAGPRGPLSFRGYLLYIFDTYCIRLVLHE